MRCRKCLGRGAPHGPLTQVVDKAIQLAETASIRFGMLVLGKLVMLSVDF